MASILRVGRRARAPASLVLRQQYHTPVMLQETLDAWCGDSKGGYYIDATVGGAGHSEGLLQRLDADTHLLCLDRDADALEEAAKRLQPFRDRVTLKQSSFADIAACLTQTTAFPSRVDGILADLGMSSHHVDSASRGFSFLRDGPLDMRFSQSGDGSVTAADLVNRLPEEALAELFQRWGEEPRSVAAARAIVRARHQGVHFSTTKQLADILDEAMGGRGKRSQHPGTRCFQALRMAVNKEMAHLEAFLRVAPTLLRPGGRLAVISFHSLEDRMVKSRFRKLTNDSPEPQPGLRPRVAGRTERLANPRCRSAKLRWIQRPRYYETQRHGSSGSPSHGEVTAGGVREFHSSSVGTFPFHEEQQGNHHGQHQRPRKRRRQRQLRVVVGPAIVPRWLAQQRPRRRLPGRRLGVALHVNDLRHIELLRDPPQPRLNAAQAERRMHGLLTEWAATRRRAQQREGKREGSDRER